jgi:hypothetical protein
MGKSTLIKLLTVFNLITGFPLMAHFLQDETIPQEGTVYKHPALRVGYVSQHATHHIGALFWTKKRHSSIEIGLEKMALNVNWRLVLHYLIDRMLHFCQWQLPAVGEGLLAEAGRI